MCCIALLLPQALPFARRHLALVTIVPIIIACAGSTGCVIVLLLLPQLSPRARHHGLGGHLLGEQVSSCLVLLRGWPVVLGVPALLLLLPAVVLLTLWAACPLGASSCCARPSALLHSLLGAPVRATWALLAAWRSSVTTTCLGPLQSRHSGGEWVGSIVLV